MNLKQLFSAKDMTLGSPWKRILEFSIPMLLGNFAQQLYNTADTIIVGIYKGDRRRFLYAYSEPAAGTVCGCVHRCRHRGLPALWHQWKKKCLCSIHHKTWGIRMNAPSFCHYITAARNSSMCFRHFL